MKPYIRIGVGLACLMLATSCTDEPSGRLTLGKVMELIAASTAADSDGDYLPDDVEAVLGTDPHDRDSDHDGIPDFAEVFGTGGFDARALLPDRDGDGRIAALDPDDDADGRNDGDQRDSDGDGISDYLEYYGYTYNWMTGQYAPWDGKDYTQTYYKTDPHQSSTDQDPFPDDVEVTGVNMDVSVREPGSLPMVPAYPDILVQLEGYAVTLKQQITWTQGESLAQGTTWERSSSTSHSYTSERSWEVGASATVKLGVDVGGEVSFHANYGGRTSTTDASTNSVAAGGSVLSQESWSRATTSDPTEAAHIKLYLKVYNVGTAVASEVIPTINLRIGGHNIATFEPGNAQINLLEPGGVYPSSPGVYWVVDSIDTGAGVVPLSLTLGELKALESGAPVSVNLNQLAAKVMQKSPDTGRYESLGDWNEYMARIRAVSARLIFDVGDGNVVRRYVYADDSVTAPTVTLGDALVWAAGAHQTSGAAPLIRFFDQRSGAARETTLGSWAVAIDGATSRANGFTPETPPAAGVDLAQLRLLPGSVVIAKAPAEKVSTEPRIHYAYFEPMSGGVTAVASDYSGIEKVEFVDKSGAAQAMTEDVPGSSFFIYYPGNDTTHHPTGYTFDGTEMVRVTNVHGAVVQTQFYKVYTPTLPEAPMFESVVVDLASQRIDAQVVSESALDAEPAFLRAFYSGRRLCTFERVATFFEDPNGWFCKFDEPWNLVEGIEIVAYVQPGVYTKYVTTAADELKSISGTATLADANCTSRCGVSMEGTSAESRIDAIELDSGNIVTRTGMWWAYDTWNMRLPEDAWVRYGYNTSPVQLHFGADTQAIHVGPDGAPYAFYDLTRDRIANLLTTWSGAWQLTINAGDVLVVQTKNGRLGKVKIQNIRQVYPGNLWTYHYVDLLYVVYLKDCELTDTCE